MSPVPCKPTVSLRRVTAAFGCLTVILIGFYFWQPYRVDFVAKRPKAALPRLDIRSTGLFDPGKRVLIVTGHPDDAAYYIGGTLFQLNETRATVRLAILTDGDKGYYPFNDSDRLRSVRRREEMQAARYCGIDELWFFGLPDSRIAANVRLVSLVAKEIERFRPELVLSFDPDYPPRVSHRDHRTAGEATARALRRSKFTGWHMMFSTLGPNTAADVTAHWNEVEELLAIHRSQFSGDRLSMIRTSVKAHAEEAGERFGPALAEPFRAVRLRSGRPVPE